MEILFEADEGEFRPYTAVIGAGLTSSLGSRIARLKDYTASFILTDENVSKLHLSELEKGLADGPPVAGRFAVPPEEDAAKTFRMLEEAHSRMSRAGLDRDSVVVAFGGGAVTDLAGFAAATFMRGIERINCPTTLTAQLDAAVGGKTGINTDCGKNLAGVFNHPSLVVCDLDLLSTLDSRALADGYAEAAKCSFIADAALFEFLSENAGALLSPPGEAGEKLLEVVSRSLQVKARFVKQDPYDRGIRRLLNYGHTVGHALEYATGYQKYSHGEAIAIGMSAAAKYAARERLLRDRELPAKQRELLEKLKLPVRADVPVEAIVKAFARDKKKRGGNLRLVVAIEVGEAIVFEDVNEKLLAECVAEGE